MIDGCNGNVRALERRDLLIKWGRRGGCILLAAALLFGCVRFYGGWRKQHLAKQTQDFVARGDFQNAVLVARRLLELDQNNLAACRAMAEMAEKSGRADAITWRKKVAHAEPIPANQIALVKSALRFGEHDLARKILKSLPAAAQNGVEFHQLAAADALAQKDIATAEKHFAAATKLAPDDLHLALNLAVIRIASGERGRVEEGRAKLMQLAQQAAVRVDALRALAGDALARGERDEAGEWATQLIAEHDARFADRILHYRAVAGTDPAAPALEELKVRAAESAGATAELITFLNRQGQAQSALEWASALPSAIKETQPVPLAIAESYSFAQNWTALQGWVAGKNWGEFESLRLAVESHALHRLSPPERPSMQTETTWRAALKAAQHRPDQLLTIAQLAEGWGYQADAEEAWWTIANSNENAKVALSTLQRLYKAKSDTRGLLRVAKRALELNPGDLVAANNCASLGLLLSGDSTSRRLASKLHSEHPTNRAFAATYAYALHTEGKSAEGVKVFEQLKEEELRHPAMAAYYVIILVDAGNLDRARSYLPDANRASLLPEERQLLAAASRKLATRETNAVAQK